MSEDHFEKLIRLIEMEREAEKEENKRELEKYPLQVREALGKTVTHLQIADEDVGVGGMPLLVLFRAPASSKNEGLEGGLSPFHAMNQGDNVRLSYPPLSHLDPVDGTLYDVDDFRVTVALDQPVPDPLPPGSCQLDLLGSDATFKRMRQALHLVRRSEKPDLVRLREIFLGNKKPSGGEEESFDLHNRQLNEFQVRAVSRALGAADVALIHGPPGTGKTTVLVEIMHQAVKKGLRVLASAPSNIAVDNMVEKLLPLNLRIVRMGHPARILEPLRHVTLTAIEAENPLQEEIRRMNSERHRLLIQLHRREDRGHGMNHEERRMMQEDINRLGKEARDMEFALRRQIIRDSQIVLCTHGGMSHLLDRNKFDLLVLDEASQATEPLSWIPLTLAKKVVFAGDSNQLPPTIYSRDAAGAGLSTTLFDRLQEMLPSNLQTLLRVQYRMHEDIMRFSSESFYEGKLLADESVRRHTAEELPGVEKTDLTDKPVTFIDTAGSGYDEAWNELLESRENEGEAQLALQVLEELKAAGLPSTNMAIITPYVAQVKRLRLLCLDKGVEIGSVDSFQGREKEAVIVSLVRSNPKGEVGFLSDTRRMNVAMTRARRLLVVIGDSATISRHPFYRKFLDYIDGLDVHRSVWEWISKR